MTRDELQEIKELFEERSADTRRHFDVVAERLEEKIGVVAEGHGVLQAGMEDLRSEVAGLSRRAENVEAGLAAFRTEVRHEFSELRSLLKLSYAELDSRVSRLEGALAEMASRLERLEKSRAS